jgi:hypothetical protein
MTGFTLAVLGLAIVMMAVEPLSSGRRWPRVKGWLPRALALNGAQAAMVFVTGVTWDRWFPHLRIWDASGLGRVAGALEPRRAPGKHDFALTHEVRCDG